MQNHLLTTTMLAASALGGQSLFSHRHIPRPSSGGLDVRKLRPVLLLFVLAISVCAQEFVPEHVVFPISDFKPHIKHLAAFSMKFGTGFCLDLDCRFVGTNYHAAKVMGKYVRMKGVFSRHRYLDSDPSDAGAQDVNFVGGSSLKYTPAHDLAIYEMRHPIKDFQGIGFDSDDLENSSERTSTPIRSTGTRSAAWFTGMASS